MVNALDRLSSLIKVEGADGTKSIKEETQVKVEKSPVKDKVQVRSEEAKPLTTEEVITSKETLIHENQPRVYEHGYSVEILAKEFAIIVESEMIKQNISSISADAFGMFHAMGIRMPQFKLVKDVYTDKEFYVLDKFDKSAHNKQVLLDLARKHKVKIVSIKYTRPIKLNIPINLTNNIDPASVKYRELRAESLTFTAQEIKAMEYAFLNKFSYYNDDDEQDWLLVYFNLENLEVSENAL